jgi:hypothetical protein
VNFKRILGIVSCVAGLVLIGVAFYIKGHVAEGKAQIAEGQQKIDQTKSLFSIVPQTKNLGDTFTSSGQKRIDAGQQQVAEYTALANKLQIAGIVLAIVGAGIAILCGKRKA